MHSFSFTSFSSLSIFAISPIVGLEGPDVLAEFGGNCLQPSVIYQATVIRKDNNTTETYIGLTENDFKTRYRNHTASFRHAKDNKIEHFISWRILSSHSPYNSSSKRCNLCLKEKFLIICRPELSTLNKRNELVSSCRHRNKALLRNN